VCLAKQQAIIIIGPLKKVSSYIYPDHPPLVYRILKDLSRKLFSLIHKKRFDKDAVIGYYGTY